MLLPDFTHRATPSMCRQAHSMLARALPRRRALSGSCTAASRCGLSIRKVTGSRSRKARHYSGLCVHMSLVWSRLLGKLRNRCWRRLPNTQGQRSIPRSATISATTPAPAAVRRFALARAAAATALPRAGTSATASDLASRSEAHPGWLVARGCHHNKKTGDYYCQRGGGSEPVRKRLPERFRAAKLAIRTVLQLTRLELPLCCGAFPDIGRALIATMTVSLASDGE